MANGLPDGQSQFDVGGWNPVTHTHTLSPKNFKEAVESVMIGKTMNTRSTL